MLDAEQKMKLLISNRPWEHEPNIEEWIDADTGYRCTVMRHSTLGHLNGYVAIPKGHKVWGILYNKAPLEHVEVHGGLTYSDEDKKTGEWVFGFDCSHGGDMSPKLMLTLLRYTEADTETLEFKVRSEKYRTFEWVKEEVCSLARQLKMLDMKQGEMK